MDLIKQWKKDYLKVLFSLFGKRVLYHIKMKFYYFFNIKSIFKMDWGRIGVLEYWSNGLEENP